MKTAILIAALACVVASAVACVPPNCDHPDYGTCGNACCNMTFVGTVSTDMAARVLNKTLSLGGPDGRYHLSVTAEGPVGFANFTDYNMPVNFLGQTIHHTKVHHYNDTINIAIGPLTPANTSSIVTAFSISEIAGAYGDAGQNYKNIISIFLASGVSWSYTTTGGCPGPVDGGDATPGLTRVDSLEELMEIAKAAEAEPEEPVVEPVVEPEMPEDLHASCRLTWTFDADSCSSASAGLAQAAKSMSGLSNCVGEKCGYTLESANSTYLQAYHVTPVHHYRDDISMTFDVDGAGCITHAYSTSTIWYAVLDDGTNYCNLRNLVEASGLSFTQVIDKSDCTQYSTANCSKY